MASSTPWYRWPSTRQNSLAPWYKILWNLIWIAPIYMVGLLLVLLAFCKDGPYSARELYRGIF